MRFEDELRRHLDRLAAEGLLRERGGEPPDGIDVCSNDYLGYARRVVSRETMLRSGAGASRLIFGTRPQHTALEEELAAWVGAEDALLFASGYAANLGTIAALATSGDLIVSDRLNHASIVDGCRLSRAAIHVVEHCDADAVRRALAAPICGRKWVVTESYFSMDGDSPDLPALRSICDASGAALVVDEAHALGVLGPQGSGLCQHAGVLPDVLTAGLGKAVGAQGAFVAGSRALVDLLWNQARSFVFSTASSPLLAAIALDNVRAARADDRARAHLAELGRMLGTALEPIAHRLPSQRHGPIFPVRLGAPDLALGVARRLRERGYLAQAIRPPTVPAGQSCVRIALHADLARDDIEGLAAALLDLCPAS